MPINLTEGAIAKICDGSWEKEDLKPIVQVIDLKQVKTQNQPSTHEKERFRLVISDGSLQTQAMLSLQMNELVNSGRLQSGSIIQLQKYTCTSVQNRLITIIIELDLIVEKCDPIGQPVSALKPPGRIQSSTEQQGMGPRNLQSFGSGSLSGGPVDKSNASGASLQNSRFNQFHGNPPSSYIDAGRYAAPNTSPIYPKGEHGGAGFPGSLPSSVTYNNQNVGFQNPRPEASRPPLGTYARPPHLSYQQPPPMYSNRGPVAKNEAPPRIVPIAALNPYQGRWTIKARVTVKGELRHYNNPRGDGKVFSFDLLDSDGGEIRVTCFNAVADQFYNLIEAGKIYLISKGSLKPAQKTFNHLRNDLEIFLESTSTIQPCFDDDNSIPQQQFHFCPISDIEGVENNSVVDVIGVVSFISPAVSIMRKNGTETQKRTLQVKDMSGRSVELTLWGNFCNAEGHRLQNMCDSGVFPVLAVKSCRVNDFSGKAIGTLATSQMFIEPDFPEARRLKEWFEKEGRNAQSVSISREISSVGRTDTRKTISQIKDEKLGTSDKPDWITVSATVTFIKADNFCYTACPVTIGDRPCNKKVTNNGDGKWRCDRCDQSVNECDYRYILQFQIQDHTGLTWVTAFQECGEEIMGISAKDLYYLKFEEQGGEEKFLAIIRKVLFTKYIFKLKVKEETFSDEQRVKSTVVRAEKMNYSSEARFLLDLMDKHKAGDLSCTVSKVESNNPSFNPGSNDSSVGNIGNRNAGPAALNYMGNTINYGREFGLPANQVGQYGNQRNTGIPSSGPGFHQCCNSCGATGHSSINCPSIMNGPGQSVGGHYANRVSPGPAVSSVSAECFKCHQIGHWAKDCPEFRSIPPAYGPSGSSAGRYGAVPKQQVGGF